MPRITSYLVYNKKRKKIKKKNRKVKKSIVKQQAKNAGEIHFF